MKPKFSLNVGYLYKWIQAHYDEICQSEWYEECFDGDKMDDIETWFFIESYIMPLIKSNIQYDFGVDFDVYELIDVEVK